MPNGVENSASPTLDPILFNLSVKGANAFFKGPTILSNTYCFALLPNDETPSEINFLASPILLPTALAAARDFDDNFCYPF